MYSLVMLMAVSTTSDASSFGWRAGCYGGFHRPVVVVRSAPVTYSVGCYGSPSYVTSGWGSCSGIGSCSGSVAFSTSTTIYSSYGGCFGSSMIAGPYLHGSCFGSCSGISIGSFPFAEPTIIYSNPIESTIYSSPMFGSHVVGECIGMAPTTSFPGTSSVATPVVTQVQLEKPASITVELPMGAELYVDHQLVTGQGRLRTFTTPALSSGRAFYYDMKAILKISGDSVTEDLKVVVHSGDRVEKSFSVLIAAAQKHEKTQLAQK
jgi:uncharacterized protein (TIGR03000 family)